jgi:hypothetical protein
MARIWCSATVQRAAVRPLNLSRAQPARVQAFLKEEEEEESA